MSAPEPGSEIDGFRLGEMIHAGSMAFIYRLTGPQGPLPLVMKIPRLGPGERAVNVIGFEVCRMVLGALAQGPHHPTLVAYGDVETTPYLVMAFVEGIRLNDWIRRAPIAPEEIARLGAAFALALHELHRKDVVHLDLKPTNVMYRAGGEAVLIDFGLAHHSHFPDLLAEELRFPVGNWEYMSPEQVLGCAAIRAATSIALGGILYELATGRIPFGRRAPSPSCASGSIATPFRRAPSSPGSRSGCRRSSCVASRSTRARATPRPTRSRSTWRTRPGSNSPSAARGAVALAGARSRDDGCRPEALSRRRARRPRHRRILRRWSSSGSLPGRSTKRCARRCAQRRGP